MRSERIFLAALALAAAAAAAGAQAGGTPAATYIGAEACLECHSEVAKTLGPHGSPGFGKLSDHGCESCHGPGSLHADDPDVVANRPSLKGKSAPVPIFTVDGARTAEDAAQAWIVDPKTGQETTIPRDRKPFRIRCVFEP